MNFVTYQLAMAVRSAVFASLMNAWNDRDDEAKANRHFKQADHLDSKFKTQHGLHYEAYIERYEEFERKRLHAD
ncbi:hypothetical protein [Xanthomonas phage BUDD]|nr:hypothetical protein [Xanthomonas phage BUDD]